MIRRIVNSRLVKHYLRDPSAIIGSVICLFMLVAAIFAPLIAPQNPYDLKSLSYRDSLKPPIWMKGGQTPFLLGTDEHGRGIFSTILYGLRVSLGVGFGVVILAGIIGSIIGLLAGFYRRWFDTVSMRLLLHTGLNGQRRLNCDLHHSTPFERSNGRL